MSKILLLVLSAALLLANSAQTSIADGESTDSKSSDAPAKKEQIQGHVLKIDDKNGASMPRLSRPTTNSNSADGALNGKPAIQSPNSQNDLLKARVLRAAGLGNLQPLTPASDALSKHNSYSLNAKELKQLSQFDISVLIDASGSMARKDCRPLSIFTLDGNISRWEWCRQQTSLLVQEVSSAFPSGITVIPFANRATRYTDVSPSLISDIFNDTNPGGATRLDEALDLEFNAYFSESSSAQKKKPLLIAVITDGVPTLPRRVVAEILDVSRNIKPGDLRIEFFLIGDARQGAGFVDFLSHLSFRAGAPFDVVSSHSFEELTEEGLARSLAHAVKSVHN